ncbi:MAG: molybdopterin molybdotransferase MoeA [Rhodobacterales bacterium]
MSERVNMERKGLTVETDPCGCDERTGVCGLVPVSEAILKGVALAKEVHEAEMVTLEAAIGRVIGHDLHAPFALPPFDNSAMDGYALRSADFTGNGPWRFSVTGRVAAGDDAAAAGVVGSGEAFRIFTGAAIPAGADAVIMQEHVTRVGDVIEIKKPVSCKSCIRLTGEDAQKGNLLLPKGTLVGAREIGAIASVGLPEISVRRKLRIGLFCSGSELRQPGEPLNPGQIYNSNRFMMLAMLRHPWTDVTDYGAIEDDPGLLRHALAKAAKEVDIIVTIGGVSVGEEDHMVTQLRQAGGDIEVMKPGKPLSIGRLHNAVFIGLPGNPVAAFTTWKIIGAQIAARAAGLRTSELQRPLVEAAQTTTRRPGRQEFRPARIVGVSKAGYPKVELLDHSFSAKISLICQSDGFAVIPAEIQNIRSGDHLEFVYL